MFWFFGNAARLLTNFAGGEPLLIAPGRLFAVVTLTRAQTGGDEATGDDA